MRSGIHGTFATLLLMIPVLSIPALAIFGIPQFAPVVASPLDEGPDEHREKRVGKSARLDDEMIDDLGHAPEFGFEPGESKGNGGRIGDSIPISRGRNMADRDAPATKSPRSQLGGRATGRDSWQDDHSSSGHGRDDGFDRDISRNQPAPPSNEQLRDLRFDAPQTPPAFGNARIQKASMSDARDTSDPRFFHRQRDRLPETGAEIRTPSRPEEPFTWQDAVNRLNALEIRNFRLQPGHRENQFAFVCNYTPSDSPRVSYRFEAEADEPLKAVEKVLEQIAEWQQRR